jgi:hypothetical protein
MFTSKITHDFHVMRPELGGGFEKLAANLVRATLALSGGKPVRNQLDLDELEPARFEQLPDGGIVTPTGRGANGAKVGIEERKTAEPGFGSCLRANLEW